MGSITPFATPDRGHVRLEVDWSSHPHSPKCFVYRVLNGVATLIREGDLLLLSNGRACIYDTEAPLDTAQMRYRTVAPMNANGDFQETVEEWTDTTNTGTIGSVTQSADFFVPGRSSASLRLTQLPGGSQATLRACSEFIPATVGTTYTLNGQLMVPTSWTGGVGVQIFWYAGTSFLSASGTIGNFWPGPGVWEPSTASGAAPATTTQMRIVAAMTGSPPPDLSLYAGEMYVTEAASTVETADVLLLSAGAGWWKDPLHPAANVRLLFDIDVGSCEVGSAVAFVGIGDRQRPADSALLEVPDSPQGLGVFGQRKSRRSSIRVASATYDDAARVADLHGSGAPLLLQLPPAYGEPDFYGLYSELTTGRVATDQRVQIQLHAASYATVRPPVGAAEGVGGTRYSDLTKFSTYAQATAASVTWFDALQGELAG
jgi:hypothetical protein